MVTYLTPASRRRPRFFDSAFVVAVALIVAPTLSLDAQSSPATPGRARTHRGALLGPVPRRDSPRPRGKDTANAMGGG